MNSPTHDSGGEFFPFKTSSGEHRKTSQPESFPGVFVGRSYRDDEGSEVEVKQTFDALLPLKNERFQAETRQAVSKFSKRTSFPENFIQLISMFFFSLLIKKFYSRGR